MGRMTPLCWYESGKSVMLGLETVQKTAEKLKMIRGGKHLSSRWKSRVFESYPSNWCWQSLEVSKAHSAFHRSLPYFAEGGRSNLSDCLGEDSAGRTSWWKCNLVDRIAR